MVRSFYCGYEDIAIITVEANLDWDEEVTQDILFKHLAWREQIPLLWAKAIPRYYFADSDAVDIELHGFSDASE